MIVHKLNRLIFEFELANPQKEENPFEEITLNEINKKQFEKEIVKAKGNKKELARLKTSLKDLKDLLPQQYIDFLSKKIEKAK